MHLCLYLLYCTVCTVKMLLTEIKFSREPIIHCMYCTYIYNQFQMYILHFLSPRVGVVVGGGKAD